MPLQLLLVEDDTADAYLTQATLEAAGVDAEWRHVVRLADIDFDSIGNWAECALVDLSLPDSQGLDTVKKLLAIVPELPVVVVSGNSDQAHALAAVHEGAQDYLVKGRIEPDLLARTIRYAIERKTIQRELQRSRQMARLGQLAGGMAHHFNNLHAVIVNYAEFVAEALSDAAAAGVADLTEARKDMAQIQLNAGRAVALTQQLTIFAEQDAVQSQIIRLNDVIEDARELISGWIGTRISLELNLGRDVPDVLADRRHIEHLLASLADNARQAMPEGGRVTIDTASFHNDRQAGSLMAHRYARVRIRDIGTGIASDIIDRVFDPFFSGRVGGQHAGLGLAVVHAIMERWGGQADVASSPGAGTTVTLLFPAAAALNVAAAGPR
jgi:two-component system cell cycle sensor histidine kinase/response regulator CckA